jgi:hypothetical protein
MLLDTVTSSPGDVVGYGQYRNAVASGLPRI